LPFENSSASSFSEAINRGFSKQSIGYDEADRSNIILLDLRHQVYKHVEQYLSPDSYILELNAGTGLDAHYFVSKGHRVHATDLADGMVNQIRLKISSSDHSDRFTCQQVSFANLDTITTRNFDCVFSNFGGLNCIQDLSLVSRHLPSLIKPGGHVTWVIMPPVCPGELLWILKGNFSKALRRLGKNGTLAHVAGEHFPTYYHSLKNVRSALGSSFKLLRSEGLAALSPQPHLSKFASIHPGIYKLLRRTDAFLKDRFPFNRWADHIIVTFQYRPEQ